MTRGIRYENFALNTLQLIELDENIRIRMVLLKCLLDKWIVTRQISLVKHLYLLSWA